MMPSAEDIIARRRMLAAEYEAKQQTAKKENVSRPQPKFSPISSSDTPPSLHHGHEYKGLKHPTPTTVIQQSSRGDGSTSGSTSKEYPSGEPPDDFRNSPSISMELPSVEDIVARRRRLPSENTSNPQPSEMSTTAEQEEEELPAPELVRALEAVGCCPTPRGSASRRRSLDTLSLPDELFLDQLLSNQSSDGTDLLSVDQAEARKGTLYTGKESTISSIQGQRVRPLVAAEANLLQKSTIIDSSERRREPEHASNHGEREKHLLSIFPPRDCSNVGLQKQKRCTGLGLGRHIFLVPPPRRRVDVSELYVNEVVLVKRDRNIWVFAQLKILTCRGIRAWVPSVPLFINVPIEIMYTHLRKLDDDEDFEDLPEFAASSLLRDEDHVKEQRIPLPTTFDRGKNFKVTSERPPKRHKQLHVVRPAHLAHRTLHQPLESTLPCTICFQLMSPTDAHKPWDCEHSCHLFCYQLVLQGTNSNSCNTCSAGKSWDWKTITCQCGFAGFVQKRVDDLEPPSVCPSCRKLSPILSPYRSCTNSGSELPLRLSVPVTSSSNNFETLMALPSQRSTTHRELTSLPKLSRRAIGLQELEWRHVNCECGLRGMIRTSVDSRKPPMCPACLNPVQEWSIPREDDLLKALLGYTPPDSPTSSSRASTSPSQPVSPHSSSKVDDIMSSDSDFSLFDGMKPLKVTPSTLLTPNNTPSSMQSVTSPVLCDLSENSSYVSCPSSPRTSSPPSASPPKEPQFISPPLVPSSMPTSSTSLSTPLNQAPSPNKQMLPRFGPADDSNATIKPHDIAFQPSPITLIRHSSPKPPRSPASSPKPPRSFEPTKPRQLPTDSLAIRITRTQIRQQMEEQAKKQIAQILETKLTESEQGQSTSTVTRKQNIPANSGRMWMTPTTVEESFVEEQLSEQSMQDPSGVTDESQKSIQRGSQSATQKISSSTDSVSMWMTPELIKQMVMEEEMKQKSDTMTVKKQPPPSIARQAPPTVLRKPSSTDSVSMWMTPELIKQMAMEDEMKQMSDPTTIKNKPSPSILKQVPTTLSKKTSSTDSVSMWMTPELIKQMMEEEELRQEEKNENSSRSAPRLPHPKLTNLPLQTGNLPTDSVSMWMTPAKIKRMAIEEEGRKQQDQPEPLPKLTKRNLPTDSASLWLTPFMIKQMVMREEEIPPVTLGEELRRPISKIEEEPEVADEEEPTTIEMSDPSTNVQRALPTDSVSYWMTPEKVKKMQELQAQQVAHFSPGFVPISLGPKGLDSEDFLHQEQDRTPSAKQMTSVYEPSQSKQAPQIMARASSSSDSVSMWMTPELIKQMVMEEELRQRGQEEPTSMFKLQASVEELPQSKQATSTMPKKSSSTDSVSMGMTPELIKQMMIDEELRQRTHSSGSGPGLPHPKLPMWNAPVQTGHLPTDSVSMWMTPAKIKKMAVEDERRKQQDQPKPPPKLTKRHLPTDSASLWLTPSKIKQMVTVEEENRRRKQDPPMTLGDELRRPISMIEEESEVSDEEQRTTIQMLDGSSDTQQVLPSYLQSYRMTPDKVKKTHESQTQQGTQFNHGFVPAPSRSEDLNYIDETQDTEDDVSSSQPQEQKPIQALKILPLTLQLIPEEEEVTHKRSPETRNSQSFVSSSSSPSLQHHSLEPTSLATRLQKLKATENQTLSPHMLPAIPNQPDQPTQIPESGWITIVRDGQASLSADKSELEKKAKEVESNRGME